MNQEEQNDSVVILISNNLNHFALQLRSAQDNSYPLCWNFSAAGGIEVGETHEAAAHRELIEELGIEIGLNFETSFTFEGNKIFVYIARYSSSFNPSVEEVERVQFFSIENINHMINTQSAFHPEFVFVWEEINFH